MIIITIVIIIVVSKLTRDVGRVNVGRVKRMCLT